MNDEIKCEICQDDDPPKQVDARYALSLSQSNSGANINFMCDDHFKLEVDFMLHMKIGSVDVQAMWIPMEEQRIAESVDKPPDSLHTTRRACGNLLTTMITLAVLIGVLGGALWQLLT